MGKHRKQDKKLLAERPDVVAAMQYIAETETNLELLKAEKKTLKANLKDAKQQLKKLLKAKPEKKAEKVKTEKKPKPGAKAKAKVVPVVKQKTKVATTKKAAGKKLTKA